MPESEPQSPSQKAQARLAAIQESLSHKPQQISFPLFDDLPPVPGQPQGSLWNFFSHASGVKDELGTLNLLTHQVVLQASQEIRTGQHVQLDWSLSENIQFPGFGRKPFQQKILDSKAATKGAHIGLDDQLNFNTQGGSQWDSLKHFAHQKSGLYYNGATHEEALKTPVNGIHNWCERGGIVGRGVLVDWLTWYENKHGKASSPISRHEIPVSELDECLKSQGTITHPGDILIIRSGFTRWHNNANAEERKRGTRENSTTIGLQSNETTVRWLYDHHFAAVAGDTVGFEAWPPPMETGWCLHEWLLVQWGTPIGELWDLEQLSKICEKEQRYSFFLTSAPLHVKGGVGSPPGAIAIF